MTYNPFDKRPGSKLSKTDLNKLVNRKVNEGYFVEFKSAFPKKVKITHSIASFANTYGGWYIVGVDTDDDHIAKAIPGVSLKGCFDPVEWVRAIITSHIDPVPTFYPQVIRLSKDKAVFIAYVPDKQETPFLTKDGRIYRRAYDSSEPVPETSRYALDRLVERGNEKREEFKRFCQDERGFCKAEDDYPWMNIYAVPIPPASIERRNLLSKDSMAALLNASKKSLDLLPYKTSAFKGNIPFDTVLPTYHSVVFRQNQSQIAYNTVSLELFPNGAGKIFVPLEGIDKTADEIADDARSSEVRQVIKSSLSSDNSALDNLRFFNVGKLFSATACLFTYYEDWLAREPLIGSLEIKIDLINSWRLVAFFDRIEWAKHVREMGFPVIMHETISIPNKNNAGIIFDLKDNRRTWLSVIGLICLGIGLPNSLIAAALASLDSNLAADSVLEQ